MCTILPAPYVHYSVSSSVCLAGKGPWAEQPYAEKVGSKPYVLQAAHSPVLLLQRCGDMGQESTGTMMVVVMPGQGGQRAAHP